MIQTTIGLFVIGWKLALALVAGSSVLTTIGVWALARFTTVFDAYAGERAKLMAQFQNLDKLVVQTEKLTATTETIKARISDEVWDRQMRWAAKRDSYIQLMETLGERHDVEARLKLLEQIHRQQPGNTLYPTERDRALLRSQEVQSRMVKAACVAPLLVSPESHHVLIETSAALKPVHYDHPTFEADSDHNLGILQNALNRLLSAARKDLDGTALN
jgi:hypothetical protein